MKAFKAFIKPFKPFEAPQRSVKKKLNFFSSSGIGAGRIKMKVFWNKGYEVIISAHNIISKIILPDSYFIVDDEHMNKFL